jgi:hypothetical protein
MFRFGHQGASSAGNCGLRIARPLQARVRCQSGELPIISSSGNYGNRYLGDARILTRDAVCISEGRIVQDKERRGPSTQRVNVPSAEFRNR